MKPIRVDYRTEDFNEAIINSIIYPNIATWPKHIDVKIDFIQQCIILIDNAISVIRDPSRQNVTISVAEEVLFAAYFNENQVFIPFDVYKTALERDAVITFDSKK